MAVSFWLPKVIVILAVSGISCAFDDLLDRVRLSKSNDPEVRDFLDSVLRHRNDFKWIQEAVQRGQIDENVLPLQGLPLKNKRSFYSSRDGYPQFRSYGYKPHRYIGYERPINDAYPYEEENEATFDQKSKADSMFNKRNIYSPQYDFLDEEEPVISDGNRKKREVEEYDFEYHQVPANLNKRDQDMEKLLNEKMILHSILRNKERPRFRKVFKDMYEKNLPNSLKDTNWDQIQVFPNAEKGVLYAPGNKFEYKTDGRKRCVDNRDDEHDLLGDFNPKKLNSSLEAPLGEFYYSNPHDILGITKDLQMEMHDTKGVATNLSCTKIKRSIHLDDFLSHPGKRARKEEDKSIKIKIFDDGRLVKDIKKGEANSIVLTIKNDKPNVFQSTEKSTTLRDTNRIMDELNIYSNMLPVYQNIRDDNTLQKIDSIIQRDQASLRLNSQIPYGSKQKKDTFPLTTLLRDDNINQLYHEISRDANKSSKERSVKSNKLNPERDFDSSESPRNVFPLDDHITKQKKHKLSYQRLDEIGRSDDRNLQNVFNPEGTYEYRPLYKESKNTIDRKIDTNDVFLGSKFDSKPAQIESTTTEEHQNRLEDQSEPTSAAEQRELGRINNSFNTPNMEVMTTEKMMIIPFKKNAKLSLEDETDEDIIEADRRFKVKDSRDMIHPSPKYKKSSDSEISHGVLLSKNLKDADDVLDKLKSDLEKTIKNDYSKGKYKAAIAESDNYEDFDDSVNHANSEYDDELKTIQDDNVEISKEVESVGKKKKSKAIKTKLTRETNTENEVNEDNQHTEDNDFHIRKLMFVKSEKPENDKSREGFKKTEEVKNLASYRFKKDNDAVNNNFKEKILTCNDNCIDRNLNKFSAEITQNTQNLLEENVLSHFRKLMSIDNPSINSINEDYLDDNYLDSETKSKRSENEENNFRMPQIGFLKNNKLTSKKKVPVDKNERNDIIDEPVKHKKETKRNLFTNKIDFINKRESSEDLDESEPPEESNDDNDQNKSKEKPADENELDIIEKTQAILLHITNPPADVVQGNKESPTMRGEFDDIDDPNSKLDENRAAHNKELKVKHTNIIKVQDFDKNDDIVGEIMKLVKNFKENERRKHVQPKKANPSNVVYHRYPSYDDADESSFSHHLHKDKKAHPTSINNNNCKIKPGTDHYYKPYHPKHIDQDSQYSIPKAVKEGYADVETISDKDNKHFDNSAESENVDIKRDSDNHENPMKYTPDRLDSFKDIIETPRYRRYLKYYPSSFGNNDVDRFLKKYGSKDSYDYKDYLRYVNKRYAKDNDGLISSQFNGLRNFDDSSNTEIWNKYNNYNPYLYPSLQRYRQEASPGSSNNPITNSEAPKLSSEKISEASNTNVPTTVASVTTTQAANATEAILITTTTPKPRIDEAKLRSCITVDRASTTACAATTTCIPSKHGKTHKPHGHNAHLHHHRPTHREESERERKLKEKNRDKLKNDLEKERLNEQEHLKNILNGHIMLEIMDKFQERIKQNDRLYNRFGHGLGKKCAAQQVAQIDAFREEQSKKDIKHAQLMLHQVILMMNKIVADQVHRRGCMILPPTIREFLQKMANVLRVTNKGMQIAEGYPLPPVGNQENKPRIRPEDQQPDFLFDNPKEQFEPLDAAPDVAMKRKISLIRRLLKKYEHMSERCQVKVQPVKEYLEQHLEMLEKMQKENKFDADFNDLVCTLSPAYLKKCKNITTAAPVTSSINATTKNANVTEVQTTGVTVSTLVTSHAGRSALKNFQYDDPYMNPYYERNFGKFEHGRAKSLSEKYRKLVEAAENYRRKRQIEKRLAHLFGQRKRRESNEDKKKEVDALSNIDFEAPIVYSLDE